MIYAIGQRWRFGVWRRWREIYFYFDGVDSAVVCGGNEGDTVLVADELSDLAINFLNGFGTFLQKDAASGSLGECPESRVRFVEILCELLKLFTAPFLAVA